MVTKTESNDHYGEQEAQRRFERLARAALNTPPSPLKSMTPKGKPSQSKKPKAKVGPRRG